MSVQANNYPYVEDLGISDTSLEPINATYGYLSGNLTVGGNLVVGGTVSSATGTLGAGSGSGSGSGGSTSGSSTAITLGKGSLSVPSLGFSSDYGLSAGLYQPAASQLAVAAGGNQVLLFSNNAVSVLKALSASSGLTVTGLASLVSAALTGTLSVTGASTLAALAATNAAFSGTLGVTGASTLANTSISALTVTGNATVGGSVFSGDLSSSSLEVANNATVGGTLGVAGGATLGSLSATSFANSGNETIGGTLVVTGTLKANGAGTFAAVACTTLAASSAVTLATTLGVTGASTLAGVSCTTLAASGNSTVGGTLGVSGASTLAAVTCTILSASGNSTVGGTLGVTGASTLAGVSCTALAASGNSTIGGTLGVTGTSTLGVTNTGNMTVTGNLTVSGTVTGGTVTYSSSTVSGNQSVGGTLTVNGTSTLAAVNEGNTAITGTLGVSGTSTLAAVNAGNTAVTGTLSATGTSTLAAVNEGNTAISGTLSASGASTLAAVACTTLAASGNSTVGGTLGVTGSTTLASATCTSLGVSGTATVGTLNATNASLTGSLSVTGTSTLGTTNTGALSPSSLNVTANATVGGTLTATGTSTLAAVNSGNLAVTGTLSASGASTLAAVACTTLGASGAATVARLVTTSADTSTYPGPYVATCLDTTLPAGPAGTVPPPYRSIAIGKALTTNNAGYIGWQHYQDGNVGNLMAIGTVGQVSQFQFSSGAGFASLGFVNYTAAGAPFPAAWTLAGNRITVGGTGIGSTTGTGAIDNYAGTYNMYDTATSVGASKVSIDGITTGVMTFKAATTSIATMSVANGLTATKIASNGTLTATGISTLAALTCTTLAASGGATVSTLTSSGVLTAPYGYFSNSIAPSVPGLWLMYNYAGNGRGNFVNNQGTGTGGFDWRNANSSGTYTTPNPLMTLDASGNLTTSGAVTSTGTIFQGTASNAAYAIQAQNSALAAGGTIYFGIGVASATNNEAQFAFNYVASGSSSNAALINVSGTQIASFSPAKGITATQVNSTGSILQGTASTNTYGIQTQNSALAAGSALFGVGMGVATSVNNTAELSFYYAGAGSTSNAFRIGMYGNPVFFAYTALTGTSITGNLSVSGVSTLAATAVNGALNVTGNAAVGGTVLQGTATATSGQYGAYAISCQNSAMANATQSYITLGQAATPYNQLELSFYYVSSGNTQNSWNLGTTGITNMSFSKANGLSIYGNCSTNGSFFAGTAANTAYPFQYQNSAAANNTFLQGLGIGVSQSANNEAYIGFQYVSAGNTSNSLTLATNGATCGTFSSAGQGLAAPVTINTNNNGTSGTGLTLQGTLTALKSGGGLWTATSDARLKKNIEDYTMGLDEVERLRPVKFQYNGKHECAPDSGKTYVGFVAQEAQQVFPDMVEPMDDEDAYLTMDTSELLYALVNSVKTLSAEVKSLKFALAQASSPVRESRKRPASAMEH